MNQRDTSGKQNFSLLKVIFYPVSLLGHQPYCDRSHSAKLPLRLVPSMYTDICGPPTSPAPCTGQQEVSCCGQRPTQCYTSHDMFYLDSGLLGAVILQPLLAQVWPHCVGVRIWSSPFTSFLELVLEPRLIPSDTMAAVLTWPSPSVSITDGPHRKTAVLFPTALKDLKSLVLAA